VTIATGADGVSTANYSCQSGFQLVGDSERVCSGDQWNEVAPRCLFQGDLQLGYLILL